MFVCHPSPSEYGHRCRLPIENRYKITQNVGSPQVVVIEDGDVRGTRELNALRVVKCGPKWCQVRYIDEPAVVEILDKLTAVWVVGVIQHKDLKVAV
ncbi:hypothetical protein ASE64_04175 [Agreia sp. Leaf210]|nr:hypothetical protein ASE64_04175 [Agreia sp. Leaf210]